MAQESPADTLEVGADSTPQYSNFDINTHLFSQERLKSHAKSFDGLLSLIPAKYYYGEDTSVRSAFWALGFGLWALGFGFV